MLDQVHHVLVSENIGKAVSSFDGLSMMTVRGSSWRRKPG